MRKATIDALQRARLALCACNNCLCTDQPYLPVTSRTSWTVDNSKEIAAIDSALAQLDATHDSDPDKPGDTRIPIGPTDCISMHRHARLNPAHRLPNDHGINACDVFISGRLKRLIRQAHGLVEKGFVVHGWIVAGLRAAEHSYFPRFV